MKTSTFLFLLISLYFVFCSSVFAQNIAITDDETYIPDEAVILDIKSTSKGILLPRLSNEQRNALYRNVPQGMLIFNTTDSAFQVFIGNAWYPLSMGDPQVAGTSPVADIDGNVYSTVEIGNQIWMAENLRTTHYADGTPLIDGTTAGDISGDYTTKYYFWYNNDSSINAPTYGTLYTWPAAMNGSISSVANPSGVQGVCPDGWHLPSDDEWKELEMYLGMSQANADEIGAGIRGTNEGSKLAGNANLWTDGNLDSNADFGTTGFHALPGGYRSGDGTYNNIGLNGGFWSATQGSSSSGWYRGLNYEYSEVSRWYDAKYIGFSVRCTKD